MRATEPTWQYGSVMPTGTAWNCSQRNPRRLRGRDRRALMFRSSRLATEASWYLFQSCRGSKKAAKLPVLLKKAVDGVGEPGEQVTVNQGFAHNWLFPRRLAAYDLQANHGGRKPRGSRARDGSEPEKAKNAGAKEAQQLAQIMTKLLSSPVQVKRKFRRGTILEGQVTVGSIVDAVAKQRRIDISHELVELQAPIITHGTFDVPLGILRPDGEKAVLKVVVAP